MRVSEAVVALMAAMDAMRSEQSDANAERVADALDAILLRDEPPVETRIAAEAVAEGEAVAHVLG